MTAVLYRRERELLNYIVQFQEQHGYSPTLREMADAMGRNSVSTIHALIRSMVDKGYIQKVDGNNRTLKVLKRDNIGLLMGSTPKAIGPTMMLPLMGYIAAGQPLEPHTDPDASFPVASTMLSGKKASYVLQVKGNSMVDDGILDGDYVVIQHQQDAQNGDIVVALLPNGLATLKRIYFEKDKIKLMPSNSTMSPIFTTHVKIQGRVVGLIRKYSTN